MTIAIWTTTPIDSDILFGALWIERTSRGVLPHRLPASALSQFPNEYLARVESQPSGVRLAFDTNATAIELEVLSTKTIYSGAPMPANGQYDLLVDGRFAGSASAEDGNLEVIDPATQSATIRPGPSAIIRFADLSADRKAVEIWLPQTETTELIALRADCRIEPGLGRPRRVWLHHGSSISQGSTAASPSATWPARAAARGVVDLVNMGFSGNAVLDPFTARAIRDTAADLISLKVGVNLANTDVMRMRAFVPAIHGFLDTIREGHPDTPLLVVSPILSPIQEDTPGPIAPVFDGGSLRFDALGDPADPTRLTLNMIRGELSRIVTQRAVVDQNLYFLDGRALYGDDDFAEIPLPDQLHPDPEGHRRIGERFADAAFGPGGFFAPTAPPLASSA